MSRLLWVEEPPHFPVAAHRMTILESLLLHGLAVYIVTTVLTQSHVMAPVRWFFRDLAWEILPEKMGKMTVKWFATEMGEEIPILEDEQEIDLTLEREIRGFDAVSCNLCSGFWIALVVCICAQLPLNQWLAVYGTSFFLTKLER